MAKHPCPSCGKRIDYEKNGWICPYCGGVILQSAEQEVYAREQMYICVPPSYAGEKADVQFYPIP